MAETLLPTAAITRPRIGRKTRAAWPLMYDARVSQGLSQHDLAANIGTSQTVVARWERGEFKPSPRSMTALAAGLNLPVELLRADAARIFFAKP